MKSPENATTPSPGPRPDRLPEFLNSMFNGLPPSAVIEVRLIEDRRRGRMVDRRWYPTAGELLADLDRLLALAETRAAAVFFGVLPRRGPRTGKTDDVVAGRTAWVDIDFKDLAGGEAEARKRFKDFPAQPSIVVRSGHGLHLYWLVREPTGPDELSALSKRLAEHLGGDHAFDAARILRLPGTYNRKDPAHPIPVEIEVCAPERTYNPSEIDGALDIVGVSSTVAAPSATRDTSPLAIPRELPPRVLALIRDRKRVGLLFNGEGKPEIGADGRPLDRSSSGYDFSLVLALARLGVREAADLEAALWHRPGGDAKEKGAGYIQRTVASALALIEESEQTAVIPLEVERVRIFNSNPASYEFTVEGKTFTLTSAQLRSPRAFGTAYMDALHRVPDLPSKPEHWAPVVNAWLESAETVELPMDASREPALREATDQVIADMAVGDELEDLNHGKAVMLSGDRKAFRVDGLLRRLHDDYPDLERGELCRVLHTLGYRSGVERVAGQPIRVWRRDGGGPVTRAENP